MTTLVLGFLKILYIHIISLIKLKNLEKGKWTSHTIAHITVFACAFCHMHTENLLKGPAFPLFTSGFSLKKAGMWCFTCLYTILWFFDVWLITLLKLFRCAIACNVEYRFPCPYKLCNVCLFRCISHWTSALFCQDCFNETF